MDMIMRDYIGRYVDSLSAISAALDEFKRCSGLVPSLRKSTVFFANVPSHLKNNILELMPFEEGSLPIIYLGVPLVSSQLYYHHCKILIDRIYWQSFFVLPIVIINEIEGLMCGFLWCQGSFKRGKAKVEWERVCFSKDEGRLCIKSLRTWNIAFISKLIWRILSHKDSLWISWFHTYRLSEHNFWDIQALVNASYSWRKILGIRDMFRGHFFHLASLLIVWLEDWVNRVPSLSSINGPVFSDDVDVVKWKDNDDMIHDFSVHQVWDSIRARTDKVACSVETYEHLLQVISASVTSQI
ncbi:uncharacterized protein [Rutidosis leptorrhynchoides]|uniref:uncharacterized protein n=1 Tax=Rutidosis leptorrhynchoides TaxID=125765 RepID=UPI003A9A002A